MLIKCKATIPGNKIFMREIHLDPSMSLYKFHEFISREFGFSPDQMVLFNSVSPKGEIKRTFGLFDMGDGSMDSVTIENIINHNEVGFNYIYNISMNLFIFFALEGEVEPMRRMVYPAIVAEKGSAPNQFSAQYDDYETVATPSSSSSSKRRAKDDDCDDDYDDDDYDDQDEEETGYDEDELPEGEETF